MNAIRMIITTTMATKKYCEIKSGFWTCINHKSEEKLYTCELEVESTNQFPMIDRTKHYAKQVFNIYVHLCACVIMRISC